MYITNIRNTFQRLTCTDSQIPSRETSVKAFAEPDSDRCFVRLLDRYLPLLPTDSEFVYMRPCALFPDDRSKPAYANQRVGINTLKKIVENITCEAGVSGHYTNHCPRKLPVKSLAILLSLLKS